jgi:predicted transcriptional regulator YdeE
VAVPIEGRIKGNARVTEHERLGGAAVASVVYQGSYDRISDAYRALMAWTQANGYRAGGPKREIYLQGFESEPDPSHFVTELQLPVQPIAARSKTEQKEGKIMEPRIVTKPAFTVVGLPFTGLISAAPYESGNENKEIAKVWDEVNQRRNEIQAICGPGYGLCFGMPNEREPWYIAGFEVSRADVVPAGMMSMTVREQKYAVFPCTLGTIGATYRHVAEEWQSRPGYEHADAPDFEYYDGEPGPGDPREMKLSIYWPIK